MTPFDSALRLTLGYEGGVAREKADAGGLTNHGVTQAVYDRWRRAHGLPVQSVLLIADDEVRALYHDWYWSAAHCDELPDRLAQCAFDAAVNSGPQRAVQLLQTAVGVPDDGRFGPATRAAVAAMDEGEAVAAYLDARLDWYDVIVESDPTQVRFKAGWENRVAQLRMALLGNPAGAHV